MATPQTIFVTGASGFIAKHIVLKLLNAEFHVIGSVRSPKRGAEVRAAVIDGLDDQDGLDQRLRFVNLDLSSDDGWGDALAGVDALMHTASPFPMVQPAIEDDVIRPAVDGTLRALKAAKAAGIKRVVLTSSNVAITNTNLPAGRDTYTEDDWTDLDDPKTTPYAKSKTMAERAAWAYVKNEAPEIALTTINPSLVLGPPLDRNYGTSVRLVERLLRAKDPMLPRFGFSVVDVRDVAEMHLRALIQEETAGKRFGSSDRFLWFAEMAEILKAAYPERKIVTREAPNIVVRFLALFDKAIRSIVPLLGVRQDMSNFRAREIMGMEFIDAGQSARDTAAFLIDNKIV